MKKAKGTGAKRILVMNGPNLDMLGIREPGVYGKGTLADLEDQVRAYAEERGVEATFFQSNSEGKLINRIHKALGRFDGIVYNPGAHTHYSYAIRDAIGGIDVPCVEVHISDVDAREPFRQISVTAPACVAQVKGRGVQGYCDAIDILLDGARTRLGEGFETRYPKGQVIIGGVNEKKGQAPVAAEACDGSTADDAEADSRGSLLETSANEAAKDEAAQRGGVSAERDIAAQVGSAPDKAEAQLEAALAGAVGAIVAQLETMEPARLGPACDADAQAARLTRVRETIEAQGAAAFCVRDTSNIRWACAFDGVFDEERAHALVVTSDRAVLHTDSRYEQACRCAANGTGVEVNADRVRHAQAVAAVLGLADAEGRTSDAALLGGSAAGHGQARPSDVAAYGEHVAALVAAATAEPVMVGIEDDIALSEYRRFERDLPSAVLWETNGLVVGLRAVKDAGEIARMRAAQAVTDAAFSHIVGFMRPGMTEREVRLELEDFMLRHGAEGLAFPSIVATGANGASPHAIPGETLLEAGQCVVIDFGARARGYCSDMTRTVFLGEPSPKMRDAYATIRRANEEVEAHLRPGVTGKEAHELAERILAEGGFEGRMGHGLGHGVGIDIHEEPTLSPRNDRALVAGNVVTVEPGIYLPGEFGMRLEDFGVVTEAGFDVFTRSTHEMVIL